MLTDQEKEMLATAVKELTTGDAPWASIPALAALADQGTDVAIDFSTTDTLGAPVIIANRAPRLPASLTPRQREVCALLADGLSNKAISARLGISPATVKDHVHAVLDRLGLSRRAEVVAYLHRSQT